MKLVRAGEMAGQSVIGIAILFAFGIAMILTGVMGIVLIPYNIARVTAWIFEKLIEGIAFIIACIEERI